MGLCNVCVAGSAGYCRTPQVNLVDLMFEPPPADHVGLVDKDAHVAQALHSDIVELAESEADVSDKVKWMKSGVSQQWRFSSFTAVRNMVVFTFAH